MRRLKTQSLRQRVALHVGLLVFASLLISVSALIGMERLRNDLGMALRGYAELRAVYDAGLNLSTAASAIRHDPPMLDQALAQLELAQGKLAQSTFVAGPHESGLSPAWTNESDRAACIGAMNEAIHRVRDAIAGPANAEALSAARHGVSAAIESLSDTTVHTRKDVTDRQNAADAKRRSTLLAVGGFSLVLLAAALLVAIRQYRAVMMPLDRLALTVRSFAGGNLNIRNEAVGDREFAALSRDFNRMAAELESFYNELQTKVAVQSRELARSQRLASVGFLAAGVSHEINNPLGIITGYAERTLRMLDEPIDASEQTELWSQTRRAMSIICEEAFRCKTITTRLLSLAHPSGDLVSRVSIVAVARQVISTLNGLPAYNDRRLILETPNGPSECFVRARDGEMQQMILNLTLNALQAAATPHGHVRVSVRTIESDQQKCVELAVSDNGIGMSTETLERIFEPFYSEPTQRRAGTHGTGLGLSITHAIVTEHHGRIAAESAGPGQGSRFVVTLPAYRDQGVEAISESARERI